MKIRRPEILIIITLFRAGGKGVREMHIVDLLMSCGISKSTLKQSLGTLKELGLVEEGMIKDRKPRTVVRLTEKGRRVAEKFVDIEELLK